MLRRSTAQIFQWSPSQLYNHNFFGYKETEMLVEYESEKILIMLQDFTLKFSAEEFDPLSKCYKDLTLAHPLRGNHVMSGSCFPCILFL